MKINSIEPIHIADKLQSVLLIDSSKIDNFVNQKVLEYHGVTNIVSFQYAVTALSYLLKTKIKYQLILVDIYMPMMDGFEFVDKFHELKLNEIHGKICLLTASIDPLDKIKAEKKNIQFIEKPLTTEKLFKRSD